MIKNERFHYDLSMHQLAAGKYRNQMAECAWRGSIKAVSRQVSTSAPDQIV